MDPGPSAASRVAARWKERLSERMARERLLEEDTAEVGMAVEFDAEHDVGLPLRPVRALPYRNERGNMGIVLAAGRTEHYEHVRLRAAHERDASQLRTRVDAGIHRVEITFGRQ